jgi:hypothetical protein
LLLYVPFLTGIADCLPTLILQEKCPHSSLNKPKPRGKGFVFISLWFTLPKQSPVSFLPCIRRQQDQDHIGSHCYLQSQFLFYLTILITWTLPLTGGVPRALLLISFHTAIQASQWGSAFFKLHTLTQ